MSTTRGECKLVGGKLVGVTLTIANMQIESSRLDGDFFISTNDDDIVLIKAIEQCIDGLTLPLDTAILVHTIAQVIGAHSEAQLVGAHAQSIASAVLRAARDNADDIDTHSSDIDIRIGTGTKPSAAQHFEHDICTPCSANPRDCQQFTIQAESQLSSSGKYAPVLSLRWESLNPLVIHDVPRSPAAQMALDEILAEKVADGTLPAMLRVWEWQSSAVIIGRFQSLHNEVNLEEAKREGITVVRRVTGGGAMFVEPNNTITYSLYAPLSFVEGMDVAQSYRLCDEWLVAALRELGMNVGFSSMNDLASEQGKIGGAAQRRFAGKGGGPGAVLHHVTLAYDIDAGKMGRVLRVSKEKLSDKAVKSVAKRVDPMRSQTGMSRNAIIDHLLAFLVEHLSQAQTATVPHAVANQAHELATQSFSKDAWLQCIV
ncbi:lipoate-protein ligase A [Bifidobacterium aquikefiri]|uniref:Lipoate-protein ligase A n=1 Tax=Bifidobacterium aquikefiri TaxID=1653207 RepID=A0A261G869_9BIFI|nr:lipoate--protein ligase family protein [Bifidobacterium aquikefiri]OZG67622.1 lipoate-protein ligase A [Bifidobacterium aquikefiri]